MKEKRLRIVLLGAGGFAKSVLEGLLATDHDIVGVLPWNKVEYQSLKNRFKRQLIPDIYSLIKKHRLTILDSKKTKAEAFKEELSRLSPDIVIVCGWGEIIGSDVLSIPKISCINVHVSYLPAHRGVAPIESVLYSGDPYSGVTFHYLTNELDSGNVILQQRIDMESDETAISLGLKKQAILPRLVGRVIDLVAANSPGAPQDENRASHYGVVDRFSRKVKWTDPATVIDRKVRAVYKSGGLHTFHYKKKLFIDSVLLLNSYPNHGEPGQILDKVGSNLVVSTATKEQVLILDSTRLKGVAGRTRAKLYIVKKIKIGDILA